MMATPEQLKQFMKKMNYVGPVPTDEALQRLCRGAYSTIFQQIIEKVKPRQEVEHVKQNIVINRLQNKNASHSIDEDVEQLKLYGSKKKLEKEKYNLKEQNHESEITLEHIASKLTTRNAKIQSRKVTLEKHRKDCVLLKAKCWELDKQVVTYEQLYRDSLILDTNTENSNREEIEIKLQPILSKFSEIIDKNPHTISPGVTSKFNDFHSFQHHIQTSDILSSTKRAFSTAKRPHKHLHSTHATLKKRNILNFTFESTGNTTIQSNSTFSPGFAENYADIMTDIETSVWNDSNLKSEANQLWRTGCANIFAIMLEQKINAKQMLAESLSGNWNRSFSADSKQNEVIGMDKLYNVHIKTNLERFKSEKAQRQCLNMFDAQFRNDVHPILILEATEFGLLNSILQFQKSCKKFQFDATENVNDILLKIQEIRTDMLKKKTKIESNLCLLYHCNSWLEKIHEHTLGNAELQSYPEYEMLDAQIAANDLKNFVDFPFHSRDRNYMNSWTEVYDNPELLEIIQRPYLSPENIISTHISESNWLKQLLTLQNEMCTLNFNDKLNIFKQFTSLKLNNILSYDKLQNSLKLCKDINANVANVNSEMDIWLDSPLNQCVVPKIKFENKHLSEYVTMYDEFYKTIAK